MFRILLSIGIIVLGSCHKKTSDEIIDVTLDKKVTSKISEWCSQGDCEQCENEIFIDRISPDSTRFTIRIGGYKVKHPPRPYPIMKTYIDGIEFIVYTGAEQYLSVSGKFQNAVGKNPPYNCSEEIWTIIEKNGVYKFLTHGGEAFNYVPEKLLPDSIIFLPPNGKVSN